MKHLLKTILLLLISYVIVAFITWNWDITSWKYCERACMLAITLLAWFISLIIETADINDESTLNDEILESYHKNKK